VDLSEEKTAALARLSKTIDDDHYPPSPRIKTLKGHSREDPTGAGWRAAPAIKALTSHRGLSVAASAVPKVRHALSDTGCYDFPSFDESDREE
jgi:hypothetical protein